MKNIRVGALLIGVLLAVSACAVSGPVDDKRAPGEPEHKTFQIQVDDKGVVGPDEVWVTVPEKAWDRCHLKDMYPACANRPNTPSKG